MDLIESMNLELRNKRVFEKHKMLKYDGIEDNYVSFSCRDQTGIIPILDTYYSLYSSLEDLGEDPVTQVLAGYSK